MTTKKATKKINIQLEVSHFGPITKGKVCMKPLTIFVGPSNTGKSYMALLMYTLLKTSLTRQFSHRDFFYYQDSFHLFIQDNDLKNLIKVDKLKKMLESEKEDVFMDAKEFLKVLKKCIDHKQVQIFINKCFNDYLSKWEKQINRCIAPLDELIKAPSTQSQDLEVILGNRTSQPLLFLRPNKKLESISKESLESITQEVCDNIFTDQSRLLHEIKFFIKQRLFKKNNKNIKDHRITQLLERFDIQRDILTEIYRYLDWKYLNVSNSNPYYFPAARTGIMQSHKTIVSMMIDQSARVIGIENTNVPALSGGNADFLNKLVRINPKQACEEQPIKAMIKDFENDILKGQIDVKSNPFGYPDFYYYKNGLEIPMQRASSMVTELAPILLFLKYHDIRPGDTLIIEEPEAHLHPRAQKDIADILVALVKNGIYVILTTHNFFLIEQINNYRRAQSIPEERRKEIMGRKHGEFHLSEDDVAIYNFKSQHNNKDNIVIEPIPFDKESGYVIDNHDVVSTELYDQMTSMSDEEMRD